MYTLFYYIVISLYLCVYLAPYLYTILVIPIPLAHSIYRSLPVCLFTYLSFYDFPFSFPLVFYFFTRPIPSSVVIFRSLYSFPAPSISLCFLFRSISLSHYIYQSLSSSLFSQSLSLFMLIVPSSSLLFSFFLYLLFRRLS